MEFANICHHSFVRKIIWLNFVSEVYNTRVSPAAVISEYLLVVVVKAKVDSLCY